MTLRQDQEALRRLLKDKRTGEIIAVDTETSGLEVDEGARVSAMSVAWFDEAGELQSYAWPFDHGMLDKPGLGTPSLFDGVDVNLSEREWTLLMKWIAKQRIVMHNAKFDCIILEKGHRKYGKGVDLLDQVWWDTQNGQWVLDPLISTSLKPTAARLWGVSEADELAALQPYLSSNGKRYDLVPWDVMQPYAAKDAELTLRLFYHQMQRLNEEDGVGSLRDQLDMEMGVMRTLTRMAYRGIGYDVNASRVEAQKATQLLMKLQQALPFKPTPMGARVYFFDVQKAIPHCLTEKGGKPSVSECCVRSLITQRVPHAEEFALLQKVSNAINTYYDGYANATGSDGRLRTNFWQAGTVTMRFVSRRVNLQAIPQAYRHDMIGTASPRSLFRATEGYELWEFDQAQAEVRVAAKVANCRPWLEMFNSETPRDLHSETSIALFGSAEFKFRQIAKRANFSLIYGVGAKTFRQDLEKTSGVILQENEARDVVEQWRKLYPHFGRAAKRTEAIATAQGYVDLVDGRRRYFEPYEELHKAFNAVIQGSIAQFVKRWMVYVDTYYSSVAPVLLQIHDSIVLEIDKKHRDQVMPLLIESGSRMATEFFNVPMQAEAKHWYTLADPAPVTNDVVA